MSAAEQVAEMHCVQCPLSTSNTQQALGLEPLSGGKNGNSNLQDSLAQTSEKKSSYCSHLLREKSYITIPS